jgi:hypothetical protein
VFDPFSDASAASLAAQQFGLSGVGIGLHADHCETTGRHLGEFNKANANATE